LTFKCIRNDIDVNVFKQEIGLIDEYSQELSKVIDDFRSFFKDNKNKEETSFNQILNSSLKIMQNSFDQNNIKIIKDLECEDKFYSYPREIKQVILNILKNSEDALLENNIKNAYISAQTKCDNKCDKRYIIIKDNAKGISEDALSKIFNPYYSTKKEKDGTGLGLYMSKTIIEEHCDGKLSVQNDENGAVFTIEI